MSSLRATLSVLAAAALACACHPVPSVEEQDAGPPLDPSTPLPPAPPAEPSPPQLAPCPDGWREVPGPIPGYATTCEPWPSGGRQSCGIDEAHFPGEPGCVRIGTVCPSGDWPVGLPSAAQVLYVRPGAPAGGTGTQSAPFATIASAIAASRAGAVVVLSKGTFVEGVALPAGVTLWGACVAQTRIAPLDSNPGSAVDVQGAGGALRNLTLRGSAKGIGLAVPGASVDVRDVVIDGTVSAGVLAYGAVSMTGSRLVVRNTRSEPGTGDLGQGLEFQGGAQGVLSWVALEANHNFGAAATGAGTVLRLTDAVIRDTRERQSDGAWGRGLAAQSGATLEADRVVLENNREAALWGQDDSVLTVSRAVIRGTLPTSATPEIGCGVGMATGTRLQLRTTFIHRNTHTGLAVFGALTFAEIEDLVVRETLASPVTGAGGHGITGEERALLQAVRVSVEANRTEGIRADGSGTAFRLEDVFVLDTLPRARDGVDGVGIAATSGALLSVTRALAQGNSCAGVGIQDPGTRLQLSDATLRANQVCASPRDAGHGLSVLWGSQAVVKRALAEENHSAAIFVAAPGSTLDAEDLEIRDTQGDGITGGKGDALLVQQGGKATVQRGLLERNREVGIHANLNATVIATDVAILDTLESECPPETCPEREGFGVVSIQRSSVQLDRFVLARSATIGIALADGGVADLYHGRISENPIGACVFSDGFEIRRLENDVVFLGNGANLSSMAVPLPEIDANLSGMTPTPDHI